MPTLAPQALEHLPFYEALASLDDASLEWRTLSAGLLTLRLFDRWVAEEHVGRRLSRWELSGVAEAVESVPSTTTIKSILTSIVTAVSEQQPARVVLPMLAAYGSALQRDARWKESADVFHTVVSRAEAMDVDLAMSSVFQRGRALRMVGDLEGAVACYDVGRKLAVEEGDLSGMLTADLSMAIITAQRGNLPAAESEFDSIIARAEPERGQCASVLSKALHERGIVASRRGHFQAGIGFLNRALSSSEEPASRVRILGDMGAAFFRLGEFDAARDAHLVVYATAPQKGSRWIAALNLLQLSARTDNEPSFERYRRELADVDLTPVERAHFHLYVAEGYERFDRFDEVAPELRRAITVAEQYAVNDILFEAERRLSTLRRATVRTAWTAEEHATSFEVAQAVRTVRELKELALAPG